MPTNRPHTPIASVPLSCGRPGCEQCAPLVPGPVPRLAEIRGHTLDALYEADHRICVLLSRIETIGAEECSNDAGCGCSSCNSREALAMIRAEVVRWHSIG